MTGDFFQIEKREWERVTEQGLNASVAYLVLACGTGGDNRTTARSVNAIEKYTGISRGNAKRAIETLQMARLITAKKSQGGRPSYSIKIAAAKPDWVWLPKTFVMRASNEQPPLDRIRCHQDIRILRLAVNLYATHELADHGGIHWRVVQQRYKRTKITERGFLNLWGFHADTDVAWKHNSVVRPFLSPSKTNEGEWDGWEDFWNAFRALIRAGLLECVLHLIEADNREAEIICPCPGNDDDGGTNKEKDIGGVLRYLANDGLGEGLEHHWDKYDEIFAVPDRYPEVQLVGIYRLRYRPHTARTSAWQARANDYCELVKLIANAIGRADIAERIQTAA